MISIEYKREEEIRGEYKTMVYYSVEIDLEEGEITWVIYPELPAGMHFKKGDEFGWGGKHYTKRQSFQAFQDAPYKKLSKDIYEQVLAEIKKG